MSESLYPTRLRFADGSGIARFASSGGQITEKPTVPGLPEWGAIDYAPGAVALIRPAGGDWRCMDGLEVSAVLRWLRYTVKP